MTTRPLFSALGFTLAIFSMSAMGQVNYGKAPSPATAPAAPEAATAPAPEGTATMTAPAHAKHAGKMHTHSAHHMTPSTAESIASPVAMSGTGDPAYHAALKQCIAGPETQRDSCLDDAIARYSHS